MMGYSQQSELELAANISYPEQEGNRYHRKFGMHECTHYHNINWKPKLRTTTKKSLRFPRIIYTRTIFHFLHLSVGLENYRFHFSDRLDIW
jgi:hypothetical protein